MNQRVRDPICPLKKIWLFVDNKQVWRNMYESEAPVTLNYDFKDEKAWQSFTRDKENNHQIQTPELIYMEPTPQEKITQMEKDLKKYLVEQFQEERLKTIKKTTNWNFSNIAEQMRQIIKGDKSKLYHLYGNAIESDFNKENRPMPKLDDKYKRFQQ